MFCISQAKLPRGHNMTLEFQLGVNGQELKARISELSGIDLHLLKLICSGHVIEDDKTLLDQKIKVKWASIVVGHVNLMA